MARARNIKYGFFTNEALSEMDFQGRLLFIGLWCLCDRMGRMEDRPKRIKAEIFPYDSCDIERHLTQLQLLGFIQRYEVQGARYIQVVNFTKHQSPHHTEKSSGIPAPTLNLPSITVNSPCSNGDLTVNPPLDHCELTQALPPDSLIPDSPNPDCLIPGSGTLKEGSGNKKTFSRVTASTNVSKNPLVEKQSVQAVFEHWKSIMHHPNANLDDKRKRYIRQALQSGYSVEQLCDAIEGCSKTPHNMGHNEQGQRYDGLHVILRDADQIDRFISNCRHPPRPKTKADQLQAANIATAVEWAKGKLAEENNVH